MSEQSPKRIPRSIPVGPAGNPYNIDFAREKRLKKIFIILIGAGFIIAALMLVVAFAVDSMNEVEVPAPTPPPQKASEQSKLTTSLHENSDAKLSTLHWDARPRLLS